MTSTFTVNSLPNGYWQVLWPSLSNIKDTPMRNNVFHVLFDELGLDRVGFRIRLDGADEPDVLWVEPEHWFTRDFVNYSQYLVDMYEITGLVLTNMDDTLRLQEWLEKKYIWQILKE